MKWADFSDVDSDVIFMIRLISYPISLNFKCLGSNAVVLVFLKLLMIPEIVITLNQISASIAYKSVTYKRQITFSCEIFVCLSCISFGQNF